MVEAQEASELGSLGFQADVEQGQVCKRDPFEHF